MTLSHATVQEAVYAAVADLNESLSPESRIELASDAPVFSGIDSLAALNLLLRVEQHLSDLGIFCDLADGDFYENTVFRSPTLGEFVRGVHAALSTAVP